MFASTISLFLFFVASSAQNCDKQSCSECVQELNCAWCISASDGNHCVNQNATHPNWCPIEDIVNPKSFLTIEANSPFSSDPENVVQVRPQRVKLAIRKDEDFVFTFQYKRAKNYPVDLYYVMDLSSSMEKHRETLAQLGLKLAETMQNITSNFKMGFGSFVDKVELPFVSTHPTKLISPCRKGTNGKACVPPYSFKNHMSLSTNYEKFVREVENSHVSGNLDAPEGGLDAIMQAIVCKEQIGWRSQARHLLVYSSDTYIHIAGDGKLAGVVIPNDGQCHMENNEYTEALTYDYPSISHIQKVAKENNINIIFAIVDSFDILSFYKQMSNRIDSNVGSLGKTSENVVKLITDNYNRIVDSVKMTSIAPDNVKVSIISNCLNQSTCNNIRLGQEVNFTAIIRVQDCDSSLKNQKIVIKPEGIEEEISISIETLCTCSACEKDTSIQKNSPKCNRNGDLICGVCECHEGFRGQKCECSGKTGGASSDSTENCEKNGEICSNAGVCKCGQCECKKRDNPQEKIYGKYCECDNYSCKNYKGQLCANHGKCKCGSCECFSGWSGDACQCPDTNSTCIAPGSDLVCNGHGDCNCGKCECFHQEKERYSGQYCDKCLSCSGMLCEELSRCIECQIYKSEHFNFEKCPKDCDQYTFKTVDELEKSDEEELCTIPDVECTWTFAYQLTDDSYTIRVPKRKTCAPKPNLFIWVGGVIGTILLAGLLMLLIWKVCTTVHDRREYAKFEDERKKLKWHRNDNPLYKEATTTFNNPAYNKRLSFKK